jgi:hypothetical protein
MLPLVESGAVWGLRNQQRGSNRLAPPLGITAHEGE